MKMRMYYVLGRARAYATINYTPNTHTVDCTPCVIVCASTDIVKIKSIELGLPFSGHKPFSTERLLASCSRVCT